MRVINKLFAVLLSALMLVTPVLVNAESAPTLEAGYLAGREMSYDITFDWHDVPLFDDEALNGALSALFDALKIEGRQAKTGDTSAYQSFKFLISGEEAMNMDTVYEDDTAYLMSSAYGVPIAIANDEMEGYFTNLGAYLDTMMASLSDEPITVSYEEMFKEMFKNMPDPSAYQPPVVTGTEDPMDALREVYAAYGMEDVVDVVEKWLADVELTPYDGPTGSLLGLEAASAKAYVIDKAEMIALMEDIMPIIAQSEEYWQIVAQTYNSAIIGTDEEPMSAEEFMAEMPAVLEQASAMLNEEIPEDAVIRYIEGYDAADTPVVGQLEMLIPEEDGSTAFAMYMEFDPSGMPFYMEFSIMGDGLMFSVMPNENVGDLKDEGFTASFSVVESDELAMEFILRYSSVGKDSETGRVWDGSVLLGMTDGMTEMGLQFIINQTDTYNDADVAKEATIVTNIVNGEMIMPVLTINATVKTAEPAGAPFDINDPEVTFEHPGAMDKAAFEEHMNAASFSAIFSVMQIMSMLPEEFTNVVMPMDDMSMEATDGVEVSF